MKKKSIDSFKELYDKLSSYIENKEELSLIEKAYNYAEEMHFGIKRLTGEDYIEHPLNVAYILTEIKADSATICAALMHDILEDCDVTKEEMTQKFGKEITTLVDGVTKINSLNFQGEGEVIAANHRKILVGLSKDVRVIIIKLADRLHNMRTLWVHSPKKQKEKARETLDILTPIADRLGMSHMKSELEDLSLRYYKKDVFFQIVEMLNQTKAQRDQNVKDMILSVSNLLKEAKIEHKIKGRSKSIYSIYKKMDKGKKFSDIYDLLALRVFVNTEAECYQVLGIIHSKFKPMPKRFKDYIAMPKTNMYQSLHTTVFGNNEHLFEIQIRTYEMDEIAENGIASHWSYKERGSVKANLQNEMEQKLQFFKSLIELKNEQANDEEFVNSVKNDILKNSIYVFTPMGDVIELPTRSTPIDFAYKVHSKIGDKMVRATVNGSIVPLDYELKDNDIIKIHTSNQSIGPSREWLAIAKTTHAKNKIKSFFNKLDKEEYLKQGMNLLKEELKKQKINYHEFLNDEHIKQILSETKVGTIEDMYILLGSNKLSVQSIINCIYKPISQQEEILLKKTAKEIKDIKGNLSNLDIIVEGADQVKMNIASCCKPVPGDRIIGYITKGYGISIHRQVCPNVSVLEERLISVKWNENTENQYTSTIVVRALSDENLLLNIITKTGSHTTVQSIINLKKGKNIAYQLTLFVNNKESLNRFIHEIEAMKEVLSVERVIQ